MPDHRLIGSSLLIAAFPFLLARSGVSVAYIVNFNNHLLRQAAVSTAGMSTYQALSFVAGSFFLLFLAFLMFAAGLALASSYYTRKQDSWLIPAGSGSFSALVFLGFSAMTLLLCAAIAASVFIVSKQSSMYFSELKHWKLFRTGSRSVSNALLVFNVIVAAGILVSSNTDFYRAGFRNDLAATMTEAALAGTENRELVEQKVRQAVEDSEVISSYVRWLPVIAAVQAWFALELLRLLLSNAAGVLTYFLLRP